MVVVVVVVVVLPYVACEILSHKISQVAVAVSSPPRDRIWAPAVKVEILTLDFQEVPKVLFFRSGHVKEKAPPCVIM